MSDWRSRATPVAPLPAGGSAMVNDIGAVPLDVGQVASLIPAGMAGPEPVSVPAAAPALAGSWRDRATPAQVSTPTPAAQPSIMDQLQSAFAARQAGAQQATDAYLNNQQSLPSAVAQVGTQGLAAAGDIGSTVLGALNSAGQKVGDTVYNALPQSTQEMLVHDPVLQGIGHGAAFVKNNVVAPVASYVSDKVDQLGQSHPEAAANLNAAGRFAGAVAPFVELPGLTKSLGAATGDALVAGGKAVAAPVAAVGSGIGQVAKGAKFDLGNVMDSVAAEKGAANVSYQAMRDNGAVFTPNASRDILVDVARTIKNTGKTNDRLHGDTLSVLKDIGEEYNTNGSLDLESLDQFRQLLGGVVSKNTVMGQANPDAMLAKRVISQIDDSVNKVGAADLASGTPEAVQSLQDGRAAYAKSIRMNRIARLVQDTATDDSGSINTNALQTKIKTFLRSPTKTAGYSSEELDALRNVANEGLGAKSMRVLGLSGIDIDNPKGLQSMLGGLAGVGAAVPSGGASLALTAAGTAANKALNLSTKGKLEDAFKVLKARK